jgi:hypothetical protein
MTMRQRTRTLVDIEIDGNSDMNSDHENSIDSAKPGSLEDEDEEAQENEVKFVRIQTKLQKNLDMIPERTARPTIRK